ncbi:MAG TPA: D-alanyl-D-alanine carboxypeptidase family protein [Solirubrobacteraceae bacterium]|jgi:D-alanyl-D-alanine carboxypeptidase
MSDSPFLTPGQSRLRRQLKEERRRKRRLAMLAALVGVLAAGAGAVALARHSPSAKHGGSKLVAKHAAKSAPHLSADGFALSKPALALTGIQSPSSDPIQVEFKYPPRAGLLFNLGTGQVLWQRNPYERLHIASLTKMMTALLTVESSKPSEPVLITKQAVDTSGSKVGVLPLGHHVKLETMLYGLLLPSGNDAAVALAQHVAGSVDGFVKRMNEEAARLGMGCTRYTSPSGYYNQGNYSCAADLAMLAHVDSEQPRIKRVVSTYAAILPFPIKGGKLYLYNNNPLLIYHYPGTTGMKTGFTESAGRCLVATAERDGVKLGVVLLNSSAPGTQAKQLLDRGFKHVYHLKPVVEPPIPPGA